MPTALIIGASRGIGHELARQYRTAGYRVLATARQAADLAKLTAIGAEAIALDVTNAESIAGFGWKIDDELLDVAILNAGVYGPKGDGFPTEADFDAVMHTNVLAAFRLLPLLGPLVAKAQGRLAVISSIMASIGSRTNPGGSLYRASKAALNSVLKDTSLIYGPNQGKPGATCVALHPGWVKTDMGGAGADLEVEHSARDLCATLARLTPADNGSFLNHNGQPLSW
jgi:NAD(P)-dependent dehydrogenase (short-subunit alcohol dehydrogenase family)